MPIYEYECQKCHHQFDLMQKMSDDPVKQCPKCFQNSVERMVSAAGFQLKGTGWYQTDFKNKSSKEPANKESPTGEKKDVSQSTPKKGDDN